MMPLLRYFKIPDSAVLGDNSRISGGEWFMQEIERSLMVYKKNFP